MFNYEIKEKRDDHLDTVILKSGITGEFTLRAVEGHMDYLRKSIKEMEGKKTIEDAKATNYMSFNPFLADLSEEQLHAAHLYFESMAFSKTASDKIKECEKTLEEYQEEIDVIYETLGFVKTNLQEVGISGDAAPSEEPADAESADESKNTDEPQTEVAV